MKNNLLIGLIVLLISFFSACDIVEAPYIEEHDPGGGGPGDGIKKVLLEEYTGHDCVYCPPAAVELEDLKEIYGENLVTMAVHAGWFARIIPGEPLFDTYYGSDAGETWITFFKAEANPTGMVNRIPSAPGNYTVEVGDWGAEIAAELEKEAEATITIENLFNDNSRKLETTITSLFFESHTDPINVVVCITQDSIIDGQKNNDLNIGDTPVIEDYVFMHMLRASINGDWGESLSSDAIEGGIDYEKTYTVTFPDEWIPKDCHVIAFVYNEQTKTIIQVEEAAVLE